MSVQDAIAFANSILPGVPAPDEQEDPRWQAIIEVGEYVESNPEELWRFVVQWGSHEDPDLRAAIATCLLEHLLAYHFDLIFPRVEVFTRRATLFADTFLRCFKFGQTKLPRNSRRFGALSRRLGSRPATLNDDGPVQPSDD